MPCVVRCGLLDITEIRPHTYPMAALPAAMDAAAGAGNFDTIVVQPAL
jgi:alcohol dehydrogenase